MDIWGGVPNAPNALKQLSGLPAAVQHNDAYYVFQDGQPIALEQLVGLQETGQLLQVCVCMRMASSMA